MPSWIDCPVSHSIVAVDGPALDSARHFIAPVNDRGSSAGAGTFHVQLPALVTLFREFHSAERWVVRCAAMFQ